MRQGALSAIALGLFSVLCGSAFAQTPAKPPAPAPAPAAKPVARGAAAKPFRTRADFRKRKSAVPAGAAIVAFPGFNMLPDGSSRVFVELSRKADVTESKTPSRVTYRIKGAAAPTRTNRLPLITDFFPTPVSRVQLVEDGSDVNLVIDLREEAAPVQRIVDNDGAVRLQIDFPPSARSQEKPPGAGSEEEAPAQDTAKRSMQTKSLGTSGTRRD
jgi:hypothetical protein